MLVLVVVVGTLAQVVAWTVVASGGGSVWTVVGPTIGLAGLAALVVGAPPLSGELPLWLGGVVGVVAGLTLYGATRAFVALVVARWWPAFERHAMTIYRRGGERIGLGAAVAAGAVAVGEELFWRGTTFRELGAHVDAPIVAAVATLGIYVAANVPSRNLAIVAGAIVGGAVWGALAWATAGVLASIVAHATWTALMLLVPVVPGSR
jgi:membrane protease YdiL (CAAX protease family)